MNSDAFAIAALIAALVGLLVVVFGAIALYEKKTKPNRKRSSKPTNLSTSMNDIVNLD